MTLRELAIHFTAAADQVRRDFERDTVHAYQVVRIWTLAHAPKGRLKMPKLSTVLPDSSRPAPRRKRQSTRAELKGLIDIIAARHGGKIVKV